MQLDGVWSEQQRERREPERRRHERAPGRRRRGVDDLGLRVRRHIAVDVEGVDGARELELVQPDELPADVRVVLCEAAHRRDDARHELRALPLRRAAHAVEVRREAPGEDGVVDEGGGEEAARALEVEAEVDLRVLDRRRHRRVRRGLLLDGDVSRLAQRDEDLVALGVPARACMPVWSKRLGIRRLGGGSAVCIWQMHARHACGCRGCTLDQVCWDSSRPGQCNCWGKCACMYLWHGHIYV